MSQRVRKRQEFPPRAFKETDKVMDGIVKICIPLVTAGVLGMVGFSFSTSVNMAKTQVEVSNIADKVRKLEEKPAPLTSADLNSSLGPLQQTVTRHESEITERRKDVDILERRVGNVETNIDYIRRDIGTITEVLKTGRDYESKRH